MVIFQIATECEIRKEIQRKGNSKCHEIFILRMKFLQSDKVRTNKRRGIENLSHGTTIMVNDSSPTRLRVTKHHSIEIQNRFKSPTTRSIIIHYYRRLEELAGRLVCVRAYHEIIRQSSNLLHLNRGAETEHIIIVYIPGQGWCVYSAASFLPSAWSEGKRELEHAEEAEDRPESPASSSSLHANVDVGGERKVNRN